MKKTILLFAAALVLGRTASACSFTATATPTIVTCAGASNGTITVNASGGLGVLNYSINGGTTYQTSNVFTGLASGTYTVTILDNGDMCTSTIGVTVGSNTPMTGAVGGTMYTCYSACSGYLVTTVSGGVPPYTYSWTSGVTGPVFPAACPGTYGCLVVDATGCVLNLTGTVIPGAPITPYVVSMVPANCTMCDGQVEISASGGTPPYVYQIDGGPTTTSAVFTGLCAGTHNVIVTDGMGCIGYTTITITSSGGISVSASSVTQPSCGMCDGALTLSASGGAGGYTYSIDGGGSFSASPAFTALCDGTYDVQTQDAGGCIGAATVTLVSPALTGITVTPTIVAEGAPGLSDGSIDLAITGSPGPFAFLWSNGATTEDLFSLGGGTYTVTITSGTQCSDYTYNVSTIPTWGVLTGRVYIDVNGNCTYDGADANVPYNNIMDGAALAGTTNALGHYGVYVTTGTHTFAPTTTAYLTSSSACAVSGTVTIAGGTTTTLDFPMEVTGSYCDGAVTTITGAIVPGFPGNSTIGVYNYGYAPMNATLKYVVPQYVTYTSAYPAPSSISGDTLIFTITGLNMLSATTFYVYYTCPPTPSLLGLTSMSYAFLDVTSCTDAVPANNNASFARIVAGSYDPNDKSVMPMGDVDLNQEDFTYYIRFQNTGNGPAVNITVTDTLDADLDPSTIEILDVSHAFEFSLIDGDIMHFRFGNIMLPDSGSNEAASHGYIQFRIKPKNTVMVGTEIENTANIYFDFNPPVITNTTDNLYVAPLYVFSAEKNGADFNLYPNPTNGTAQISLKGMETASCKVFDVYGKTVMSKELNTTSSQMDFSKLSRGVYTIVISNDKHTVSKKLVKQ